MTKVVGILSIVSAVVFLNYPEIDIYISSLFWDGSRMFYLADEPVVIFVYRHVNILSTALPLVAIGMILYQSITKKEWMYFSRKNILYVLLVGLLGASLLVNGVLKNHWHRARPRQVVEFGGDKRFAPPILISDQCSTNCSFVSGHSSFGYIFLSLWFLYRRWWVFLLTFGYGSLIGFVRIVQGGHFLSDVIFSFFVMYGVAYLLHRVMYTTSPR